MVKFYKFKYNNNIFYKFCISFLHALVNTITVKSNPLRLAMLFSTYFFFGLERSLLLLLLLDELELDDDRDELPELLEEDRDVDLEELLSEEL